MIQGTHGTHGTPGQVLGQVPGQVNTDDADPRQAPGQVAKIS
jgi:hypothetical protein